MGTRTAAVSVIMPVKNAAASLRRSLESVALQTVQPFEVIIVDNNSTDESVKIARSFAEVLPIRVLACATPGSGAARNVGILAANGDDIAFLDADDVWYPMKLQQQIALAERSKEGYFFSGTFMHYLTPFGRVLGNNVRYADSDSASRALRAGIAVPTPLSSVIVSRQLIATAGLFNETFLRAQDFEWMSRLIKYTDLVIPTGTPMIGYVMAGGTSTDTGYVEQALAADAVRKAIRSDTAPDYYRDVILVLQEQKIPLKHVAGQHYRRAGIHIGQRRYVLALIEMAKSLFFAPIDTVSKLRWQVVRAKDFAVPQEVLGLFLRNNGLQ